ncbi:cyclophilin-like family protein [Streptomyces sp. AGS-58]|uniref:cyclophilin-like family protein n=1 Tax=unclassified Streptomyces TaxID=2593676 RepID=UPI0035A2C8C0
MSPAPEPGPRRHSPYYAVVQRRFAPLVSCIPEQSGRACERVHIHKPLCTHLISTVEGGSTLRLHVRTLAATSTRCGSRCRADTHLLARGQHHREPRRKHATHQGPLEGTAVASIAHTWGEDVYFDTGVSVSRETDARPIVAPGTVAARTDGDALTLPYGPPPISQG